MKIERRGFLGALAGFAAGAVAKTEEQADRRVELEGLCDIAEILVVVDGGDGRPSFVGHKVREPIVPGVWHMTTGGIERVEPLVIDLKGVEGRARDAVLKSGKLTGVYTHSEVSGEEMTLPSLRFWRPDMVERFEAISRLGK